MASAPNAGASLPAHLSADDVVRLLELAPHPEGGFFQETFRDRDGPDGRALSTAIYYLLSAGEVSRWHKVDAAELWHWYAGAPLELAVRVGAGDVRRHCLGPDLAQGERPQVPVPAQAWQSARSLGPWTLAGCTVAPGFEFSGFELAPEGWRP